MQSQKPHRVSYLSLMKLRSLSLTNYKNLDAASYSFDAPIVCFVGKNGVGKSNLLDAIYHLCFGKGYFNPSAVQNIRFGEEFFVIEGTFQKKEMEEHIFCSLKKGNKKVIKRNGKAYERFSDHIGLLPLVMISPSDRDLIAEGSGVRRKFMDGVIGQADKAYLQSLLHYNKLIAQRNALLKYFAANQTFDAETLAIYDTQIVPLGLDLHQKRTAFLADFVPLFQEYYQKISSGDEQVIIQYESALTHSDFETLLKETIAKDRVVQYTTVGIHKEDLSFQIHEQPIKKFGSQGQQKSFLIALKLAQYDFLKKELGVPPIVLLDDVFDKLDQERVELIMQLVEQGHFGQLFLSDTHPERTLEALKSTRLEHCLFEIKSE